MGDDFARRVTGLSALAEPVRRALYEFVVAHGPEPVGRDQAAAGVGVAHHTAKFHLDRLVADGLLETRFRRLSGRTGPGAGRPAKLYVRAQGDLAVSVPPRHYDLAARLMAEAIERSTTQGVPVVDALHAAAAAQGRSAARSPATQGEEGAEGADGGVRDLDPLSRACGSLAAQGYEPRLVDGEVVLTSCPFHALAAEHTSLVCGMNLALLDAFVGQLGGGLRARLEPAPDRCCVVLSQQTAG
jgi:predicted ArsR family transcriptional regulator